MKTLAAKSCPQFGIKASPMTQMTQMTVFPISLSVDEIG
jgi:hypothetical protein